jgi:hypothetical protein
MGSSELRLQAGEQVGMDAGIDFLAEDLLGTLDGQRGNLLAQHLAGTHGLLVSLRDFTSSCSTRWLAEASSALALSEAARPAAIFCARSSSAFAMGGHTNFIVNSTSSRKTMA